MIIPPKIMINFITNPKVLPGVSKKAKKLIFSWTKLKIRDINPKKKSKKPMRDKYPLDILILFTKKMILS